MKNIFLFSLVFALFFVACESTTNVPTTNDETTAETTVEPVVQDISTWEGFWAALQEAAKNNDRAKVDELTIIVEDFSVGQCFQEDMRQLILSTKAEDVDINKYDEEFGDERRILFWEESSTDEDGTVYESAIGLYFGKIDGRFGIVMCSLGG